MTRTKSRHRFLEKKPESQKIFPKNRDSATVFPYVLNPQLGIQ